MSPGERRREMSPGRAKRRGIYRGELATESYRGASEATGNLTGSGMEPSAAALPTKSHGAGGYRISDRADRDGWVSTIAHLGHVERLWFQILASATMTFGELEAAIKKTKSLTDKPFGVNMRRRHRCRRPDRPGDPGGCEGRFCSRWHRRRI